MNIIFLFYIKDGKKVEGLCSNWLFNLCKQLSKENNLTINNKPTCYLFLKKSNNFNLPKNIKIPLIFIATGTGKK